MECVALGVALGATGVLLEATIVLGRLWWQLRRTNRALARTQGGRLSVTAGEAITRFTYVALGLDHRVRYTRGPVRKLNVLFCTRSHQRGESITFDLETRREI